MDCCCMWCFVFCLIVLAVIFAIYMRCFVGVCYSKANLNGKTVLITGADKGIGYETALDLARRNARVIMACRDISNAERAAATIKSETGNQQVFVRKIDMSSLACVREFAKKFLEDEKKLHILINNAGAPNDSFSLVRTTEGFEKLFVTNYLGHFLLTMLLLDLLKKSSPSRIINVSSLAHTFINSLDIEDLNCEKTSGIARLYPKSKLLQIFFTRELSRQLEGTGVTVNSLHPGTIASKFASRYPGPLATIGVIIAAIFFRTSNQGAQTTIHLAVSEEVEQISGKYFSECKETKISKLAEDDGLAKKVFEASERYCGLSS